MNQFILFLHLLSAVGMGFYLLFPFLYGRVASLSAAAKEGYTSLLTGANRIGQILLVVQFLTGGYLVSKGEYSVLWMILASVLLLAIGGMTGVLGANLKKLNAAVKGGQPAGAYEGKVKTFGALNAILLLAVLFVMNYPNLF
ncbi:hypothetical protein MJA45_20195 [Paenibacillus aurantius]|uniref:DUF2269 domain-containing protein n=1 Tax=Paenibacillus aurantius TaxID=2918900 RepID=A0AA96LB55_9BACL|nr:hypothetical protein [Paenibacillus aurantius]WNQ09923.1 hypothetical protein MJA45_20195 [Paenibacillus aurantius]